MNIKVLLPMALGFFVGLNAITPKQQTELDNIYKERAEKINKVNISEESKKNCLGFFGKRKKGSSIFG